MAGQASPELLAALDLTARTPPEFLASPRDLDRSPGPLPQAHAVRRAWRTIGLCGVLYVDRYPAAYLKEVRSFNPSQARTWHRRLWNQGLAPILILADPRRVYVYSGQALPPGDDEDPADGNRLVKVLDRTADALELQQLVRSIETGQLYTDAAESFDREQGVDRYLLRQLTAARAKLTAPPRKLPSSVADALLTRTIFACYLIEREVICGSHFDDERLSGLSREGSLSKLLDANPAAAREVLYQLFEQLKGNFNGSMFESDLPEERQRVTEAHIQVLQRFLHGDEIDTGQSILGFRPYDFSMIPVETISAIYESFIESDSAEKQRETGAYYTPPHLAELVVDTAIEGWDTLLDKRVLDPACGSGIFLVSVFNRMAEEWRRRNRGRRNGTRASALARLLANSLYGVDLSGTACRIACFSLYLALLDQLEPRDIQELQEEGWRLPPLLAPAGARAPASSRTIVQGNFFDTDLSVAEGAFDLVVGNPPWVSRGKSRDATFLEWRRLNPELPVPGNQIAHGFMWRAPAFLCQGGRACLLLPSAVLLNTTTSGFQAAWFGAYCVDTVVNLADLRHLLFKGAKHPAVIIRARKSQPVIGAHQIELCAPKVDPVSKRGGPIRVSEADRGQVGLAELIHQASEKRAPLLWKKRQWGTARDMRLLQRLMDMPRLGKLVSRPRSARQTRFVKGQGFQPQSTEERQRGERPKDVSWSDQHLYLDARSKFDLVVVRADCGSVSERFRELRRSPDPSVFDPPMVVITQGALRVAFCDLPVVFRDSLQSISGSPADADLLRFLAVVLNSDLARYFFFHTAANWGMERDKVHFLELLRLPFPLPPQHPRGPRAVGIVREVDQAMRSLRKAAASSVLGRGELVGRAKKRLRPLVYEYYDIDGYEQVLIEDTIAVLEPSATPTSPSSHVPTLLPTTADDRATYVALLCELLNSWASGGEQQVSGAVTYASKAGVAVVTLQKSKGRRDYTEKRAADELAAALARVAGLLPHERAGLMHLRGLKVFDGREIHLVKPLSARWWTRTAALNDADEIASAILKGS